MSIFVEKKNRRYYLHSKVRKEGFTVHPRERRIDIPTDTELTESIKSLRDEFGYSPQVFIDK